MKHLLNAGLIALLLCTMFYVTATAYGAASFGGLISSNTTWAKANSPYTSLTYFN